MHYRLILNLKLYSDVKMSAMMSQIIGVSIACSTGSSGADQRKYQSSASLAFLGGNHMWPVDSLIKGPITQKIFPFDHEKHGCFKLSIQRSWHWNLHMFDSNERNTRIPIEKKNTYESFLWVHSRWKMQKLVQSRRMFYTSLLPQRIVDIKCKSWSKIIQLRGRLWSVTLLLEW